MPSCSRVQILSQRDVMRFLSICFTEVKVLYNTSTAFPLVCRTVTVYKQKVFREKSSQNVNSSQNTESFENHCFEPISKITQAIRICTWNHRRRSNAAAIVFHAPKQSQNTHGNFEVWKRYNYSFFRTLQVLFYNLLRRFI